MLSNVKLLFKEYDCSQNVLAANGPSGIGNAISKFSDFCNTLCVTNLVRGLPSNYHKGSPLHHIDSHTTHHTGLYFSLSIALMTHTADCTDCTYTAECNDHTAVTNHTLTYELLHTLQKHTQILI